ncbi:glycosyltransferase [Actinophytocola sp. NPDC049390]|uniref:glycosyltransferase n=1 Tax=Actinophytocola sp. NPDC049390 TaxID=3363894 RepID=UPI0037B2B857
MRALFVTVDGGGNLPPALGIAREVERRGGTARFLGHEIQRSTIERAGFRFDPLRNGRDYDASAPRGTLRGIRDFAALFADRGIGDDAIAAATAEPVDAVVVDCLLWGALDHTVRAGLPVASLVHSQWSYFRDLARGPVGAIARVRGVNPVRAATAAKVILVTTRRDLEPKPDNTFPDQVRHLGLVWQDRPVEATPNPDRPRVLVSFSTTHFPGQARAMRRVLDALDGLPIELVATTGAVDPAQLRIPPGARVVRHADHGTLLPTTALVIGHGGHATTARALAHGIPLLTMPMHPLMDQPAVARAVTRLGAGRVLSKHARAATIRAAALTLLADGPHREAAHRLGTETRDHDGASTAADVLEAQLVHAKD